MTRKAEVDGETDGDPTPAWPVDLRGFTVGVTADRRGDEQSVMLGRLGVDVVRGAALQTLVLPDGGAALRAHVDALIADPPDYFVANTGIGVRTLFAQAGEWGIADDLRRALGAGKILARGPKAAGALRLAGVEVSWRAPSEQLAEVTEYILAQGVAGQRVVFQRHGDDQEALSRNLREAGAQVTEIELYRWDFATDSSAAAALVEACCAGSVDAITFTAAPAVRRLFDVAEATGRAEVFTEVLNEEMIVACVGPVCAAAAELEGLDAPVVPDHWRLGSLVRRVGEALTDRRRVLRVRSGTATTEVVVQGWSLRVGKREVVLDADEAGVARLLAERPGHIVTEVSFGQRLWRAAPPTAGAQAVEVAIAGLRSKLGTAGASITSPGAGAYRWEVEPSRSLRVLAELS